MANLDTRDPMVKAIEVISGRMLGGIREDHPVARQLQSEVNRLRTKAEALDNVRARRSPLDTPAAHALKVAKMARTFNSEITATVNRAGQIWAEGFKDVHRRIDEKANLKPDAFASEIRTAFRALNNKAQAALINQLVRENRGPEMAAIVRAPSVLTGISDEQKALYEKMLVETHARSEMDEAAGLEEVFSAVHSATNAAGMLVRDMTDPAKLAAIEGEAAAADAAGAAFQSSFQ